MYQPYLQGNLVKFETNLGSKKTDLEWVRRMIAYANDCYEKVVYELEGPSPGKKETRKPNATLSEQDP